MKTRFIPALLAGLVTLTLPAVTHAQVSIVFDYGLDTGGFFSGANLGRRAILDSAATALQSRLADTLDTIAPGGLNTWSAIYYQSGYRHVAEHRQHFDSRQHVGRLCRRAEFGRVDAGHRRVWWLQPLG